jgi:glyoxylase-like metal-dependent hydrolase (beta-lactamase superfamily II)
VRVLGASAYGASEVIASEDTRDLIVERGAEDMKSEIERFPRLFRAVETIPGLTWPTLTFKGEMTVWLGKLEVRLMQLGRGHTKGDTIAWLPEQKILFSGDLVEFDATPYAGDAYFQDWPHTLDKLAAMQPRALVPGRGAALTTPQQVAAGLQGTRDFVADVWASVKAGVAAGKDLNAVYKETLTRLRPKYGHWVIFDHCMPFDVTRCYDEATQYADPRVWTAERDQQMWKALES